MHKLFIIIALVLAFFIFIYVETEFPFTSKVLGSPNPVNDFANNVFDVTIRPIQLTLGFKVDPLAKVVYGGKP